MNRCAIVTGASRGIGKQIAIALGGAGFDVVVAARTVSTHQRLPGTIVDTVEAVQATGARAIAVRADMTSGADISEMVSDAVDTFGRLDVVVNNAADTSSETPGLLELSMDEWLRQFDANLHGPLRLMRAAVPALVAGGGGLIVNMTSTAAEPVDHEAPEARRERLAYAASKAALNRLANALAPELRESGIAIVNVNPGFTRTELVELMDERGLVDASAGVPMEVPARVVVHLATSGQAMRYTGQVVNAQTFAVDDER